MQNDVDLTGYLDKQYSASDRDRAEGMKYGLRYYILRTSLDPFSVFILDEYKAAVKDGLLDFDIEEYVSKFNPSTIKLVKKADENYIKYVGHEKEDV